MATHGKNYRKAAEKIDSSVNHAPLTAVRLAKESSSAKFDETIEVAFRLGVERGGSGLRYRAAWTAPASVFMATRTPPAPGQGARGRPYFG